jgi:hypothetical protein
MFTVRNNAGKRSGSTAAARTRQGPYWTRIFSVAAVGPGGPARAHELLTCSTVNKNKIERYRDSAFAFKFSLCSANHAMASFFFHSPKLGPNKKIVGKKTHTVITIFLICFCYELVNRTSETISSSSLRCVGVNHREINA